VSPRVNSPPLPLTTTGTRTADVTSDITLFAAGTANQTRLIGAPARGAIYDFAPVIDQYLKAHLFGAIFERDNLDWKSRELATVGMLSALQGAESQLQAHMGFSMNVGLTAGQLGQLSQLLSDKVDEAMGRRAQAALTRQLANRPSR